MNLSSSSIGLSESHLDASGAARQRGERNLLNVLGGGPDSRVKRALHLGRHRRSLEALLGAEEIRDLALHRLQGITGENLREAEGGLDLIGGDGEVVGKVGEIDAGFLKHDGGAGRAGDIRDALQSLADDVERDALLQDVSLLDLAGLATAAFSLGGPARLQISARSAKDRCPSAIGPANICAMYWGARGRSQR